MILWKWAAGPYHFCDVARMNVMGHQVLCNVPTCLLVQEVLDRLAQSETNSGTGRNRPERTVAGEAWWPCDGRIEGRHPLVAVALNSD